MEDLFLGGQWSIILGYRRLSVKSLKLGNRRRALFYKRLCLPCEYMQVSVHVILVFSVSHAFRKNISVVACDVTCGLYAHVMNLHFALAQPISSGIKRLINNL